jgi:signal peptidase II
MRTQLRANDRNERWAAWIAQRMQDTKGHLFIAVGAGHLAGPGNLIDRLLREPGFARGEVVDFIAYGDWFVGNVADIAIVAAAGLMILLGMRGIALDGTRHVDGEPAAPGADAARAPADGAADEAADEPAREPADEAAAREPAAGEPVGDELADRR